MEKFALKLTAAVVLEGKIRTANAIVYVDRATAENLLGRGRAEVATEHDEAPETPAQALEAPPQADPAPEPQPEPEPAPAPQPEPTAEPAPAQALEAKAKAKPSARKAAK